MSKSVDVDVIWNLLGRWGKYQVKQLVFLLLAIMSCGFHMLSIVFIGYRPDYNCRNVETNISTLTNLSSDSSFQRVYDECKIRSIYNVSGVVTVSETDCTDGWHYHEDGQDFDVSRSIVSEWDLVCARSELPEISQTLVMVGQAFGAFIFTSLADRYGRKIVHIVCHVTLFAITLAMAFVPNYISYAALRVFMGTFQQGTGLTIAILNLELFPKEIRGYMEVMGLIVWTTSIGLVTPLAYIFHMMSWRYLQICLALLSAWALIEWWLIDESLRWLIANGKIDRAKAILKKACKSNKKDYNTIFVDSGLRDLELRYKGNGGVKSELLSQTGEDQNINNGNATEMNGLNGLTGPETVIAKPRQYTLVDLIKSRRLFLTSLIMWFAWTTNSLTYYGIMLISSSLAGNRFLNFFLGSVVEYPAAFVEWNLINRFGRKPSAIAFHTICGVALITATILSTTAGENSGMILGATVFTLIGKFAIAGSFSTIFLYTPELYPTNMRNAGIGMASAAARFGGMLAPFSRNLADYVVWAPGLIFGVMCAIVATTMWWVPETNNYELPQTLEETEVWYKDNRFTLPWKRDKNRSTNQNGEITEDDSG